MARLSGGEVRLVSDQQEREVDGPASVRPPKRHRFGATALLATLALLVVVVASAALVVSQLALPRQSDLTTISQLVASDAVEKLDLSGSTLTVTQKNGNVLRVESVSADEFQQLATTASQSGVAIHASSGSQASWVSQLAFLATLVLPVLVIAAILLIVMWIIRRPPRMHYAG